MDKSVDSDAIDILPDIKYQRNEAEQKAHKELLDNQDDEDSEEELKEVDTNEYIFLIDRSGSMYQTITLAR